MNLILSKVFGDKPGVVFRLYMATVLFQFALMSFCSVKLVEFTDMLFDGAFWWGIFSGFGACSLALRSKFMSWYLGALLSEIAAVLAFVSLSYDYLTRKPPIVAGSVLAATAAVFLIGGLVYERRSP